MPTNRLTVEEQIAYLRRWGDSGAVGRTAAASGLVSVLAIGYFAWSDSTTLGVLALFVAGLAGMLALATWSMAPRFRLAARGTRSGRHVEGVLHLEVDTSDSDRTRYRGTFRDVADVWTLEFANPFGWTPATGQWPCRMVFLAEAPGPVLTILAEGVLMPTAKATRSRGGE